MLEINLEGSWIMPWSEVAERCSQIVRNGYSYIKLDTQNIQLPPPDRMIPGNGLDNMKSRAAEIGGSCEFLQPPFGSGTLVRLILPMKCLLAHG